MRSARWAAENFQLHNVSLSRIPILVKHAERAATAHGHGFAAHSATHDTLTHRHACVTPSKYALLVGSLLRSIGILPRYRTCRNREPNVALICSEMIKNDF